MKTVLIALLIGLIAAIIDVVPMVIQKLDKRACISAGIHWIVLGFIIPFVEWPIVSWLTGSIIGLITALPVMILVSEKDKKALIPITVFSILLGAGVAQLGELFL